MKDTVIKGCGTALVTPFIDGEVDYEAYAALVDRQVELGADFLVALATTGETPTLSAEEKIALLRLTHGLAGGRPVVVGCGSNSVPGTLANMKLLEPYDVDAWLVVVPFYNKPTQEGMYMYFKTIAESTEKPVIIYNVPGRTGANMTAQTCLRLAKDVPNIIGIKEASGKLDQVFEILDGAPEGFALLSGDDDLTLEMMKRGAAGCISVASNIVPGKVKALTDAALDGRFEDAALIDETLKPLYKACFIESNPVPVKAALSLMGLCTKEMRLPLTEASSSTVQLMQDIIQAF
ncbi:MAG: 4-hydroxy-tetrahydrodipicolinate synthase [Bacteroidales bacterium]|nr:4-hydroxy-tetrahydrodipicolinate synthase [Bacteroidales bacterium]